MSYVCIIDMTLDFVFYSYYFGYVSSFFKVRFITTLVTTFIFFEFEFFDHVVSNVVPVKLWLSHKTLKRVHYFQMLSFRWHQYIT